MNCLTIVFPILTCLVSLVICNFYMGMFQRNDLLVAQDRLYKERVPYRLQFAKYGRVFKCPITYLRVVDRLGYGPAPKTKIIRGGLQKKYVVLRLSAYNRPISVNIYVGCQNKRKLTTPKKKPKATTKDQKRPGSKKPDNKTAANDSKPDSAPAADDGKNATDDSGGNNTDGNDAKPDDAKPDGGDAKPDGGDAKPDGSSAKPDGGDAKPDGSSSAKPDDTAKPDGRRRIGALYDQNADDN